MRDSERVLEVRSGDRRYAPTAELRESRGCDGTVTVRPYARNVDGKTTRVSGHFDLSDDYVGIFYVEDCLWPTLFLVSGNSFSDAYDWFLTEYEHMVAVDLTDGALLYDYVPGEPGAREWPDDSDFVDAANVKALVAELDALEHLPRLERLRDPAVCAVLAGIACFGEHVRMNANSTWVDAESVQRMPVDEVVICFEKKE